MKVTYLHFIARNYLKLFHLSMFFKCLKTYNGIIQYCVNNYHQITQFQKHFLPLTINRLDIALKMCSLKLPARLTSNRMVIVVNYQVLIKLVMVIITPLTTTYNDGEEDHV